MRTFSWIATRRVKERLVQGRAINRRVGRARHFHQIPGGVANEHLQFAVGKTANAAPHLHIQCAGRPRAAEHRHEVRHHHAEVRAQGPHVLHLVHVQLLEVVEAEELRRKTLIRRRIQSQAQHVAIKSDGRT